MEIYGVSVNHLREPLGYMMEHATFTWKVRGSAGTRQTEARVVVARDEAMTDTIADTGFDYDITGLACDVRFPLEPRTRYYYEITARSDAAEEASSGVRWFETGKRDEPWQGKWVSCASTEKRHPIFEKSFNLRGKVRSARLYVCGLGLYEAYINDKRVGNEYMTPYSNDYNRWIQAQTYDVTELARRSGKLSILLGNGWYKARFGFDAKEDKGFYGNDWKLIAELRIAYEDGSEDVIGTDETWEVRRSNITFSNIYDGEHRDDTLPPMAAEQAFCCDAPVGKLTDRLSTPVTIHETFTPTLITTPIGETVLDMGQEFAGAFSLRVDVPRGTVVLVQTGEVLQNGCFYNDNLRTAKSEYCYISNGKPVTLSPHFTYYGYRYMKIEGVPNLKPEDVTGYALYSDIPETGHVRTGHELLNRFLSNVRWGMKSNFLDVPTDCPQRDERMGWTGDAQVFSGTATYLQDTYAFYRKYLYDMYQEQLDLGGRVPFVVPSCAVEMGCSVWGDAATIIPWNLYRFYGDINILRDQFDSMKAWVDYIRRIDGENHHWRDEFHFGDWLALDSMNGNPEEVRGATDEGFIADIYYAVSARIVSKAARLLGYDDLEREYRELSERQIAEIQHEYYSPTGRCCVKTQTGLLLTLKYDLSSNPDLIKKQLRELFERSRGKLQTGFVGTPIMCQILSDNGMEDIAWDLLFNEDYPGWLHEVKLGATTVWERWNSLLDDGTISGTSMNSMNHYAYGSVVEWVFSYVAGLRIDEPGCVCVDFRPIIDERLGEIEADYDSPVGVYASKWSVSGDDVTVSVKVPFGGSGTLILPGADADVYSDKGNPMFRDVRFGKCWLTPGEYSVTYKRQ